MADHKGLHLTQWDAFHRRASACALRSAVAAHHCSRLGLAPPPQAHTGISAFDPLFLLIHSSIDRLLAIWQLAHPGAAWAEAGTAAMGTRAVPKGSVVSEAALPAAGISGARATLARTAWV